jgi:hypothetical protein
VGRKKKKRDPPKEESEFVAWKAVLKEIEEAEAFRQSHYKNGERVIRP